MTKGERMEILRYVHDAIEDIPYPEGMDRKLFEDITDDILLRLERQIHRVYTASGEYSPLGFTLQALMQHYAKKRTGGVQ